MQNSFKQFEVLKWASLFLEKYNREPRVAEILLQHHLDVSRAQFFARMREPVADQVLEKFEADLIKHATTGMPIQHLIGYETFYGRDFNVNKNVLIPRPETEELVQHVTSYVREWYLQDEITIVDVGTGSGIIAITLALEIPQTIVYATDISKEALEVARKNAEKHEANVTFLQGNFLNPIIEQHTKADIIVSNPPYIAKEEASELSDTVKDFDPSLALFADNKGLAAYKEITNQLQQCLNKDSAALFYEIGHQQGMDVKNIIQKEFPKSNPTIIQDINKKDRIVFSRLPSMD
ncbi:MAG TPA: peptide chain release factor N(5)-glutamine methyltransferase [Candidatus Avamphibacillus sp.]|nr:peptide chain release factor N(5)-glutamine methyltransferase [Candidatus Avamphibacillus sp.]